MMRALPVTLLLVAGALPFSVGPVACTKTNPPSKTTLYVDASGGLRLRERPDVGAPVLLTIHLGKAVTQIAEGPSDTQHGRSGKWMQVEYNNKIGWAFGPFLRPIPLPARSGFQYHIKGNDFPALAPDPCNEATLFEDGTYEAMYLRPSEVHICAGDQGYYEIKEGKLCFSIPPLNSCFPMPADAPDWVRAGNN